MAPQIPLTWLVTGCSSGIGLALTHELLGRGENVVATARSLSSLQPLMEAGASCLELDVTSPQEILEDKIAMVERMYGEVNVLVNNAGYAEVGILEDVSQDVFQRQYETNVFGAFKLTRAILPRFRQRRSGTIVMMSSMNGIVGLPGCSPYVSSKFALEGLSDTLYHETIPFNIRTLIIEPGMFRTDSLSPRSHVNNNNFDAKSTSPYAPLQKRMSIAHAMSGTQRGDPAKMAVYVVDVVKGEGIAKGRGDNIPRRLAMGSDAVSALRKRYEEGLRELREWEEVSCGTDF